MTVMSNNNSFNQMIWTIGREYLTNWCHEHGYNRTYQYHGLEPSDNAAGLATSDKRNETCASDVGKMLEDIYNGKCVSKEASEKMLELLKQQHWVTKIPSGLPPMTDGISRKSSSPFLTRRVDSQERNALLTSM